MPNQAIDARATKARIVRGPRVELRLLETHDRDAFVSATLASTELHAGWVSPARDAAAFDAYLARRGDSFLPLGVFLHETGALVGAFNLSQIFYGGFCSAYLGYYVFAGYERRGYMKEGLDLVLHLAFESLGLHRLEANIQPANTESIALVQRCGFQREGFSPGYLFISGAWRDHERWAIRQEIWIRRDDVTLG
ncbi:MAG: GNAT family N-acetyltransferase [Polyangiaceae bacterium]|nr:GNAT family N-acetyltransferase [Polyangiaceae bacterium]